jgi:hypothetical protein
MEALKGAKEEIIATISMLLSSREERSQGKFSNRSEQKI